MCVSEKLGSLYSSKETYLNIYKFWSHDCVEIKTLDRFVFSQHRRANKGFNVYMYIHSNQHLIILVYWFCLTDIEVFSK